VADKPNEQSEYLEVNRVFLVVSCPWFNTNIYTYTHTLQRPNLKFFLTDDESKDFPEFLLDEKRIDPIYKENRALKSYQLHTN
jgi:hypothetical protein